MNHIPEHLMGQAETRTINGRTRQVIPVPIMPYKEFMVMFNCSKWTAYHAMERGFYIVDFKKKTVLPGWLDPEEAYRMTWGVFNHKYRGRVPGWAEPEDMVQEGVTRLLELAGHPRIKEPKFAFRVINHGMTDYLRINRRHDMDQGSGRNWKLDDTDAQHCKPSPATWHWVHAATESMCRVIEAKGITPMELAA